MEMVYTEAELPQVAAWLWQQIENNKVIALHGTMGAGKTTLVHALCDYLKVEDTVSSPTFSIINEYEFIGQNGVQTIYHIDLYRLKNEEDAIRAGVEDCIFSGAYCLIEWPERAAALFPETTAHVYITLQQNEKRRIKIDRN